MSLVYDPKSGTFSGRSEHITQEERDARDKRFVSGEYGILSEHPPQEEIDSLLSQQEEHGFGWGIKKLVEAIRNEKTCKG